jgi:hypothetical protein
MSRDKIRQILVVLMALVLAVGFATHGIACSDAMVKSDMTLANEMPISGDMQGKCDCCSGHEKGITPATCAAFCGAIMSAPSVSPVLYAVPIEKVVGTVARQAVGHADPPDPYPPRSTILS